MNIAGFWGGRGLCALVSVFLSVAGAASGRQSALPVRWTGTGTERFVVQAMTFNIRVDTIFDGFNGWSRRRDMVCDVISDFRPDILGLQEALKHQVDDILEAVEGYAVIGVGRKDGKTKGEYSCILYRTDRFELIDSGTFWLSNRPEAPGSLTWGNLCSRICTWGRFVNKWTGRAFYVYNTHLDNLSQRSRKKSVQLIAQRLRTRGHQDPFIVTGDFNAGEKNEAIRYLKGHAVNGFGKSGVAMVDTFRVLHPRRENVGTRAGFGGALDGSKIDYILAGPHIRVLEADIVRRDRGRRHPSDHFPVTATLLIE